ncbi:sugar phosphate isomerase/epimerase family protein [Pontibacter mangrovi]|uniref:Sugar phosphate isomerase/epimerase n=1 Tax=Pontibacter mangrovi TaxID=2589816 RepID=A0A501WDI2_9BACT|nr:sugar phosphate isomerase/epimerase [Pontibacter mangrovi]TPE43566.1 sugar phosphate isomerase/epimerase [Pontibacter mangrovi]
MTTRRNFLQQASLLTAGVLLLPGCVMAEGNKNVGIQLYTLRNELPNDVKGVIGKVAKAGYREVETYGYSKEGGFWGLSAEDFAKLLKENNLTSPSGHFGMDAYIGEGKDEDLESYIAAAKAVGMEYVVVPYLGEGLRQSADDYKRIAQRLNKAAEACKAEGLVLGYHNHDFEFKQFGDTTGYDILLQETDPELVKFELDLYWAVRGNKKPADMFKAHPGRFELWHVKDMDKNDPKLNTEVGSGSINYKEIFEHAKEAGLKHALVEQENFSMDPFKSISQSYTYIKENLL